MEYDPKIIDEFAARLYSRARTIVVVYTVVFAIVGFFAGTAFQEGIGSLVGLALGGVIGYFIGTDRAFQLKLQAQTALCQVQIERNTKGSTS